MTTTPLYVAPSAAFTRWAAVCAYARTWGVGDDEPRENPDGTFSLPRFPRPLRAELVVAPGGWRWAVFPAEES